VQSARGAANTAVLCCGYVIKSMGDEAAFSLAARLRRSGETWGLPSGMCFFAKVGNHAL